MAENIEFTLQRAQATKAVQTSLAAAWVWEEMTLPQWDTAIAASPAGTSYSAVKTVTAQ